MAIKRSSRIKIAALALVAVSIFLWDGFMGHLPIYFGLRGRPVAFLYMFYISIYSIAILFLFRRSSLSYFSFRFTWRRTWVPGLVVLYYLISAWGFGSLDFGSYKRLFLAIALAFAVGINEEFFGRGAIFFLLRPFGLWPSVFISAFVFGGEHWMNYLAGNDLVATIGQMITAAGFGVLVVGIMLASGNIWLSILLHALNDLPLFLRGTDMVSPHKVSSTILPSVLYALFEILVGVALIAYSQRALGEKAMNAKVYKIVKYFGLVEEAA